MRHYSEASPQAGSLKTGPGPRNSKARLGWASETKGRSARWTTVLTEPPGQSAVLMAVQAASGHRNVHLSSEKGEPCPEPSGNGLTATC